MLIWLRKILIAFLCVSPLTIQCKDLSDIQNQIQQQEKRIADQKREQNKLQSTLQEQELRIDHIINQLNKTSEDLKIINKKIAETDTQIKHLEQQEKEQKEKLAKQLDEMYRLNHNTSILEKLLSEKAQQSDRLMRYYHYINQARVDLIKDLKQTQHYLIAHKKDIQQQYNEQQHYLNEQTKYQLNLQKIQQERRTTLDKLNITLSQAQNKLNELKNNEAALRLQIQRAEQQTKEQEKREREILVLAQPHTNNAKQKPYVSTKKEKQLEVNHLGLGKPQKQYQYPTTGKILNQFGSTQMGELKWKGIVIEADSGKPVKAIANGRVILANWLQGYGLMIIIKHGDHDLSLYGYNQSISVKEGEFVSAGQKIAEVGATGGQANSGLYFEIRRKGIPVNPIGWLK
ncbi:murein hydrolase activator EnvC [Avibacterium paragallinarum]|uniref:murein hydrolase activator EnvC n=1 Tax=Avibacterium paragallinarum TaxID=728 RepID=UPI0021F7DA7E|nr:murein hydrolase activator EnvC [Avibacterium paragallinarum]UXN35107.1 murein hydrolase activator EnvC [Avibacterium paragallinarum]